MPHREVDINAHGEYIPINSLTVRRIENLMKLTKDMKQSRFRMPDDLWDYLKLQAAANLRSMNAEAVVRLARTMEEDRNKTMGITNNLAPTAPTVEAECKPNRDSKDLLHESTTS